MAMAHSGWLGRVVLFGSLLGVAACKEQPNGGAPSAEPAAASAPATSSAQSTAVSASSSPKAMASEVPSAAPSASTAAAPTVSPELLARMKRVASACSWNGKVMDEDCKALAGWQEYLFEPINDHQAELMRLLEDKDRKIVFLAASGLAVDGITGTRDPELARVLFDALDREKEPAMCIGIALQASRVPVAELGLEERAKKLLTDLPTADCRAEFVSGVLSRNPQLYEPVVEIVKSDKDPKLRAKAAQGLRDGASRNVERQKNNCKVWSELLDDSGEDYEATAAWLIGTQGSRALSEPCKEQWPLLLSRAEALAAGKLQSGSWVNGTCGLLEERQVDEETKTKAKAVLRKVVEGSANVDFARVAALQCLGRFDTDAKTFAKSFESDPSEKLQAAAKRILETKP
ncbi:MAG: hypothetical protein AB7K71_08710 [Polyangiaceae bacterium]